MMRRALRTLRSLRFTIFLLISLAAVFLLGLIIPQKSLLGKEMYMRWKAGKPALVSFFEAIGFTDIYVSPVTLALWGLFFLNLVLVMSDRIPSIWKRCVMKESGLSVASIKGGWQYRVIEEKGIGDAMAVLEKMGYGVSSSGNSFRAVKNRFSPLATILFHLSFFLLLLGGAVSFYTKFTAETYIAEGETFTGQYSKVKKPKIGGIPRAEFTVEEVKPTYYKKSLPKDLKVTLLTKKGREVIGINNPYKEGPLSFVILNVDIAPLFVLKDKAGREVDGAFVKLNILDGGEDFFSMKDYKFRVKFYPDFASSLSDGPDMSANLPQSLKQTPVSKPAGRGKEVINPAVGITVFKDGERISAGDIRIGESVRFKGYDLVFEKYAYWVKFLVVREYGLGIVYTGFVLITAALIVRFVFFRRDIRGVLEGEKLHISGRAEYFPELFADEFGRVVDAIDRA
jgi:hypothetical protein